jgi:hypothetical protein
MEGMMFKPKLVGTFAALLSLVVSSQAFAQAAPAKGLLVLSEDGGLDSRSLSSVVRITERRLAEEGAPVTESDSPVVMSLDQAVAKRSHDGASRLFVLHVLRLGNKTVYQLDERDAAGSIVATASLAGELEDSDILLPRLVDAVITRKSVESTATVSTVTSDESRPYRQFPGTGHFVLGLPLGLTNSLSSASFGASAGFLYETERYSMGFDAMFAVGSSSYLLDLDIHGGYYFLPGFWSPYADLGLGYMGIGSSSSGNGMGVGVLPEVGIEAFRLNHTRLRVGLVAMLPFYTQTNGAYAPALLLHAAVAF